MASCIYSFYKHVFNLIIFTSPFFGSDSSEIASKYKIGDIKENHIELGEERLIVTLRVDMWVEARAGKSICTSPIRSGILQHTGTGCTEQHSTICFHKMFNSYFSLQLNMNHHKI